VSGVADRLRAASGALPIALALPLVFLHVDYQPGFTVSAGSTSAHVVLADLAVLAVLAVTLAALVRHGVRPLRPALPIWLSAAALLCWIVASVAYGRATGDGYAWRTHVVSVGKFAEYAALALAVPVLVRTREGIAAIAVSVATWSTAATVVGACQFLGLGIAGAWPAGYRQPSFLGHHDFAAVSAASLAIALAAVVLGRGRVPRLPLVVAGAAGGLGIVLSGSSAGAIGAALELALAALLTWRRGRLSARRLAELAAIAVAIGAGVVVLRGHDLDQFVRFLGNERPRNPAAAGVQTYSQRTILAYIGWRIFLDHPGVGVGWQGSADYGNYGRYLPAARRKFPGTAPLAFPSPQHPYGVQNAWVQSLSDLGVVGALLLVALFLTPLRLVARLALRGPPDVSVVAATAGGALVAAAAVWSAVGLEAGLPIDGVTWLAVGVAAWAVTSASSPERR